MQQHPIPQQISSYEFRLVGDMTLKQFAKLASGILVAFFFYQSGLPFYFKWPLVVVFSFLGVASAFLPIHERPLEVWIWAFIKSIYSPTIFIWKRKVSLQLAGSVSLPSFPSLPKKEPAKKIKIEDKAPRLDEFVSSLPKEKEKEKQMELKPAIKKEPEEKQDIYSSQVMSEIEKILKKSHESKKFLSPEFEKTPLPAAPTIPNIICGIVLDEGDKVVEGAIVEIQDIEGNPIRAMRTNKLGQFQTATPLANGSYLIITEKEPYQFDIIKIEAQGEIMVPVKIKASKGGTA